jgi:hypothetical protein
MLILGLMSASSTSQSKWRPGISRGEKEFSPIEDVAFLSQQFEKESPRLFKSDGSNEFDILYARKDKGT